MQKQALVIGLGQFGMSVARSLTDLGVEVFAVDRSEEAVRLAAEFTSETAVLDATDENALATLAPARRDLCVCAIGAESREAAFLCTALLREQGAPRIVARAVDVLHERILRSLGAHEVVNPEREYGQRLAAGLAFTDVLGEYWLSGGLAITELRAPAAFVGRTLIDLQLPKRHAITVAAIRRGGELSIPVDPRKPLQDGDIMVVVARRGEVASLMERLE